MNCTNLYHCNETGFKKTGFKEILKNTMCIIQVILFEIDCAIFLQKFHELFCQSIS